jgi:hypothetical protein
MLLKQFCSKSGVQKRGNTSYPMIPPVRRLLSTVLLILGSALISACGGGGGSSVSGAGSQTSPGASNPPPGTTADVSPPSISASLPDENAVGVPTSTTIFVTFSEQLDPASVDEQSLSLTESGVPVTGQVTYDEGDRRLSFLSAEPLNIETVYQVTVASSIHDEAGNNFLGYSWFFTTGDAFNLGATSQMTIWPVYG